MKRKPFKRLKKFINNPKNCYWKYAFLFTAEFSLYGLILWALGYVSLYDYYADINENGAPYQLAAFLLAFALTVFIGIQDIRKDIKRKFRY